MNRLTDWMRLPELRGWPYDLDAPETTLLHGRIIRGKPFLRRLYEDWYREIGREIAQGPAGIVLELGSGAGFLREIIPGAVTSDVLPLPGVDRVMSAERLDFADESVAAITMIDVLHHIPNSEAFFREASRCLCPGGQVVMIEPANSWWGRWIYQNFHHEPFEPRAEWALDPSRPLSSANGALPWIIFQRDRAKFTDIAPLLELRTFRQHTPLSYLLSGGVSMRSLAPSWSYRGVRAAEDFLSRIFLGGFSMFATIVLEKVAAMQPCSSAHGVESLLMAAVPKQTNDDSRRQEAD